MSRESVIVQPEIVHLGKDGTQMLKITNKTSEYLDNFFFCLYNQEKFQFSPDSFSLAPNEQKLIQLKLKIKTIRAISKEFAYLKTSQTNNRITILINNQGDSQRGSLTNTLQSPQPRAITEEQGLDQAYTLSSRDYRQSQTLAFNKIINEKEAYIVRLEQQLRERQQSASRNNTLRDQSRLDISANLNRQLEIAENRIIALQKEKQKLIQDNLRIHQRFQEYKVLCENQNKGIQYQKTEIFSQHLQQKDHQINRLYDRIKLLQEQGNQFLIQLGQKQTIGKELEKKVQQLQEAHIKIIDQIKRQNQDKLRALQIKIQEDRLSYQSTFRNYEQRMKQLELIASNQQSREKVFELEGELNRILNDLKKQKQERRELEIKLRTEGQLHQSEHIKFQLINNQISEKNEGLMRRIRQLEMQVDKLREINMKQSRQNKSLQQVSERQSSFVQMALDSKNNENDLLRKNYSELQKVYARYQESSTNRNKQLEDQVNCLQRQIDDLKVEINAINRQKQRIEESNHIDLMKLKKQNVELLEKVAASHGLGKRGEIEQLKEQLRRKDAEIIQLKVNEKASQDKIDDLKHQNRTLSSKVNKYKKQTKSQLKSLNNDAMDKLKKVYDQKKQLQKRVQQLQQSINESEDYERNRHKSRTGFQGQMAATQPATRGGLSQQEVRRIGIKDQRKQLQESRSQSHNVSHMSPHQMENLFMQIGELRQLDNFIRNQEERLSRVLGLNSEIAGQENARSIFRAIRFFKQIENKVMQIRDEAQQSNQAMKQLQFMKGRLTQLQSLKKQTTETVKQKSSYLNPQMMEFIRIQMKNQHFKLHEALKLAEQKHNLLKKKIYQEYRSRIITQLQKKDKTSIHQIQATLQRFIEGLSNLSHKEAVLGKETRLKQSARKQAAILRQKLKEMALLLQTKKGYCSRDPVRIWVPENQFDWTENLKLQAQLLTHDSQLHRLREQLQLAKDSSGIYEQQMKKHKKELKDRDNEIEKLKKQIIEIESCSQKQMERLSIRNEQLIRNSATSGKQKHHKDKDYETKRDKQIVKLRRDIQSKQDIIRGLKEKERLYEQMVESSNRTESRQAQSRRRNNQQDSRMREMRDTNRQLRKERDQFKEKVRNLEEQLHKKVIYINSIKGDNQENRIRVQKKEETENAKLVNQNRQLKEYVQKLREDLEKLRKLKEHEVGKLNDQLKQVKNSAKIDEKSYASIIRGLLDTLSKIYSALDIGLKKRGKRCPKAPDFQEISSHPMDVDALKVYGYFQQPLNILESD